MWLGKYPYTLRSVKRDLLKPALDLEELLDKLLYTKYKGMRQLYAYEYPLPPRIEKLEAVLRHAAACNTCNMWIHDAFVNSKRPVRSHLHGICAKGLPFWMDWIESLLDKSSVDSPTPLP